MTSFLSSLALPRFFKKASWWSCVFTRKNKGRVRPCATLFKILASILGISCIFLTFLDYYLQQS